MYDCMHARGAEGMGNGCLGVWVNELSDFHRLSMKFSVCARECWKEGVSVDWKRVSGRGNFGGYGIEQSEECVRVKGFGCVGGTRDRVGPRKGKPGGIPGFACLALHHSIPHCGGTYYWHVPSGSIQLTGAIFRPQGKQRAPPPMSLSSVVSPQD